MLTAFNKNNEKVLIEDTINSESYFCPSCKEKLVLKKGNVRCHHFAHKPDSTCSESKYADMSEWHIEWQKKFPKENIEVIKIDADGKKHIADVLINNKEIEFQHSKMPFEEFDDRNRFYNKFKYHVIWVFDGNEVFDKGYNGGIFPFINRYECLKEIKNIPDYLDIFIEGNTQYNLITEEGLFLNHVGSIDENKGITFDGKCNIEEFMNVVNSNKQFNFSQEIFKSTNNYKIEKDTILGIAAQISDFDYLIVYNTMTGYDALIDKYNIDQLKQGKKIYGKLKSHNKIGKFLNSTTEIYYSKHPTWIYQNHYSNNK